MKRKLIILMVIITSAITSVKSQGESALPMGGMQLNFGLPGYIGLDFAITDFLTLGPKAQLDIFDVDNSRFKVGVVSDFHFNTFFDFTSEWDAYIGLNAGYRFIVDGNAKNDFDVGGQIGGRYFWNEQWGINLEAGFSGNLGGGIGVTMRL